MKISRIVFLFSAFLWLNAMLHAAAVPGRWEKVETLRPGTRVFVALKSGEELDATLQEVTIDGLVVRRLDGSDLDLPKVSVRRVVLPGIREDDRVWNGLAIGAASGVGLYVGLRAGLEGGIAPQDIFGASLLAAIGMGVGALIDAAVQRSEVVYRAR